MTATLLATELFYLLKDINPDFPRLVLDQLSRDDAADGHTQSARVFPILANLLQGETAGPGSRSRPELA